MKYTGLFFALLATFSLCYAGCNDIEGAIPLSPGPGSVVYVGNYDFKFTLYPNFVVDSDGCKVIVRLGSEDTEVPIPVGEYNTSYVWNSTRQIKKDTDFFTWEIQNSNIETISTQVDFCVARVPNKPFDPSISDGMLTVSADPTDFGHCCDGQGGECETTIRFYMGFEAGLYSRSLANVTITNSEYSATIPIPNYLPKKEVWFAAQVCSGMLCGDFSFDQYIVGNTVQYIPEQFSFNDTTGVITWSYNESNTPPNDLSELIFLSSNIEGPYEMKAVSKEDGHTFKVSGKYTFGSFYFYVVAEYNNVKGISTVHTYTMSSNSEPDPVELLWPPNETVFPAGTEEIEIFYGSYSWGTTSSEDKNQKYIIDGTEEESEQTHTIHVAPDSTEVVFSIAAKNSQETNNASVFRYTFCKASDPSEVSINPPFQSNNEFTVSWVSSSTEFCDDLPGRRGFFVDVRSIDPDGNVPMLQWVNSTTNSVKIAAPENSGEYNITVTEVIGDLNASTSLIVNLTKSTETSCAKDVTIEAEVTRVTDAKTHPHPIKLAWKGYLPDNCKWTGFHIIMDGKVIASLDKSAKSFVIPSSLLPQKGGDVSVSVMAYTERVQVNSSSFSVEISDIKPVPFVNLTKPKSSSFNENKKLEWDSIGDSYEYEVYLSTGTDGQMERLTRTKKTEYQLSDDISGTFAWSVRACKGDICGELSTAYVTCFCSPVSREDVSFNVVWSSPVVASWDSKPFARECFVTNTSASVGYYQIKACVIEDENNCSSYIVPPTETSVTLPDLLPNVTYSLTFMKCTSDNEGECIKRYKNGTVDESSNVEIDNVVLTGLMGEVEPHTISLGTTVSWTVDWGRDCTEMTQCESLVWIEQTVTGGDASLIARVPSGNTDTGHYSVIFSGDSYLVDRSQARVTITADSGGKSMGKPSSGSLKVCRPNTPSLPGLMYPKSMISGKRLTSFQVAPLMDWGDCGLGNESINNYTLKMLLGNNAINITKSEEEMEKGNETGSYDITVDLEYGIYRWTVDATNYFGLESGAKPAWYYTACEIEPPFEPNWTKSLRNATFEWNFSTSSDYSSSAASMGNSISGQSSSSVAFDVTPAEVSPHGFQVTWGLLNTRNDYGHYCGDTNLNVKVTALWWSLDGMATWEHFGNWSDEASITISPKDVGKKVFAKKQIMYFYLNASNGAAYTLSKVLKVQTFNRYCEEDVKCVEEQGFCNTTTVKCDCFAGYTGEQCEELKDKDRLVALTVGLCVGGFVLLAIIVTVVVIMVRKYYKKHKALMMKPPDFAALRTPPIRMPSFAPDIDAPSQSSLSVLEAALLSQTGFQMIWDLLHHTSATEIDIVAKSLVYCYQRHCRGLELQLFLIMCEIGESQTSTVLFRANSPATRAFKFFSKMYALPYLYRTFAILLQGIIRDVDDMEEETGVVADDDIQMPRMGGDPDDEDDNACSDENINALKLQLMCQKFFVQILRSDKACPGELKHICASLNQQLQQRYPDFVYKGIGAFLFLRFYNTAITVPESYGIMPESPRPAVRKQLLLVSKVLQNLANDVMFGEKEPNMVRLNSFLTSQRPAYEQFIRRLCDNTAPLSEVIPISDDSYRAGLAVIFNQFLLVVRNNPDYLSTNDYVPPDLAELIRNSFKKKKKTDDPASAGLLDPAENPEMSPDTNITTTTTTTTTSTNIDLGEAYGN